MVLSALDPSSLAFGLLNAGGAALEPHVTSLLMPPTERKLRQSRVFWVTPPLWLYSAFTKPQELHWMTACDTADAPYREDVDESTVDDGMVRATWCCLAVCTSSLLLFDLRPFQSRRSCMDPHM